MKGVFQGKGKVGELRRQCGCQQAKQNELRILISPSFWLPEGCFQTRFPLLLELLVCYFFVY